MGGKPKVLILGSLPGQRSLETGEYYAFPHNGFWTIMAELANAVGDYPSRCRALIAKEIAVWDVLALSYRPGSLDADIDMSTAEANDFQKFFDRHPSIQRVGFNGQTAAKLFEKMVVPDFDGDLPETVPLPSTSPAYAAMPVAEKLTVWRDSLQL